MATKQWDEGSFFEQLRRRAGEQACTAARGILDWCRRQGYDVAYGRGAKWGTLKPNVTHEGKTYVLFEAFTEGFVLLASYLWDEPPFTHPDVREQFITRLNKLPLKERLAPGAYNARPRVPLASFAEGDGVADLARVHDWVVAQIRATEG